MPGYFGWNLGFADDNLNPQDGEFLRKAIADSYYALTDHSHDSTDGSLIVHWGDILSTPSTFPPSDHNHDELYRKLGINIDWSEIENPPIDYVPSAHAATHHAGGTDAISAEAIGAEVAGAANSAIAAHLAEENPHPQYIDIGPSWEEGNWLPSCRGSGAAGIYELQRQIGRYSKIGRLIFFSFELIFAHTITGGGTGNLQITGLPFLVAGTGSFGNPGPSMAYHFGLATTNPEAGVSPVPGTNYFLLLSYTAAGAQTIEPISRVVANSYLRANGFYWA